MHRSADGKWFLFILLVTSLLYLGSSGFFDLIITSYGSDVGHYLILAQSLGSGHGYSFVNDPAHPATSRSPLLFSVLLSPVAAAIPHSMLAARLFSVLIALAAVVAGFVFARHAMPKWSLAITALFAWSVFTVSTAALPQSELTFCLCLFLCLPMCDVYARRASVRDPALVALAVLMLAAMYTRLVGVVLAPALALALWLREERRKALALTVAAILGFSPWLAYTYWINGVFLEPGYAIDFFQTARPSLGGSDLGVVAQTALSNVAWYAAQGIPDAVTGIFMGHVQATAAGLHVSWLLYAIGVVVSAVVAFGFGLRARRRLGAAEIFVVLYLGVVLLHWAQLVRYLLPLAPLLYVYFLEAAEWLGRRLRMPWAGRLVVVAILLIMLVRVAAFYEKGVSSIQARSGRQDWVSWLATETEDDAFIYSAASRIVSFRTNRYSLDYPGWLCASGSDIARLRRSGATYVALHPVYEEFSQNYQCMARAIKQNGSQFEQLFRDDRLRVIIYRMTE